MKKRIFKSIMSVVLVVVMAVSTVMVSAVSTSAETAKITYFFYIATSGSNSKSVDKISIKVNGDKGSTSWHNVGYIANEKTDNASFSDIDVGTVKSVTVKNSGIDGWYPEFIKVIVNDVATTIYGNRWVDNGNEVTLSIDDKAYSFNITTAGGDGTSIDDISIKVNGDKGSTSWHDVGKVANDKTDSASFSDIDVGTVKSITVKNNGIDGWYPEVIKVTKVDEPTKTICCCKWVDNKKEVTFSVTNRSAKLTVKTADHDFAGTDIDVCVNLYDEKGNSTGEVNLSELHPKINAFERNDTASFVVAVPDGFGTVSKIDVYLYSLFNGTKNVSNRWSLEYIDVTLDDVTSRFGAYLPVDNGDTYTIYPTDYFYKVTVKTSDKFWAGTDNCVNLIAYDENNKEIHSFELDNFSNNFEKGDTDVFYIATSRKIANIKIKLVNDSGTDWHLDYVQLDLMNGDNVVGSTKYKFNKWIEADNKLYEPKSKEVLDVK